MRVNLGSVGPVLLAAAVVAGGACFPSGKARQGTGDGGSGGSGGSGGNTGIGGNVTTLASAATCSGEQADLVSIAGLPIITSLPDPFLSLDGSPITTKDQWTCRRAEIAAQAETYELGAAPAGPPTSVTGVFDPTQTPPTLTVTVTDGGKTISFVATVTWPSTGSPPYPAMIGMGGISIESPTYPLSALGVAEVIFPNDTVAQQMDGSSRGKGAYYDLYGYNATAGAMRAWAWGVSRLIDAIATTPAAGIDPTRLGMTGCSRNGKGALIAGAFDQRIALTIPQESGSGGAASWRVSDAQYAGGTVVQTLSEITGENVWFRVSFGQFGSYSTRLPFDHHSIEGMVAPRALLIIENTSQVWLGAVSTYNNSMAAHLIWDALGIPDRMGVSQIGDHSHCMWNGSQQPEVTAYIQKFLVGGGTADTNVLRTDGETFDQATWAPWDVPALSGDLPVIDGGSGPGPGSDAGAAADAGAAVDAGPDVPAGQ
jgi:hypothetical protein